MSDFNTQIIQEFRTNNGVVGGMFKDGPPMLILHHTGRLTGKSYETPLVYFNDNGRIVIVASKGGAPENPAWFYNLRSNPEVTIELGTDSRKVRASIIEGEERDRIWADIVRQAPGFGEYQTKTTRIIPLLALEPIS
jgi:deazaflavin-dependent oxidoreductase (nitroreductase family)